MEKDDTQRIALEVRTISATLENINESRKRHDEVSSNELISIKKSVDELRSIVDRHISETNTYRVLRDKLVDAHSNVIWDQEGRPGLATQMDRLIQMEKAKDWQRKAIGTGVIALIGERIAYFLK